MPRVAPLRIAVVGAGLGGLTAAVALRQAGFDVAPTISDAILRAEKKGSR
jgi:cation diffusion facilitator CzcD-associated flavoprotein CzcO